VSRDGKSVFVLNTTWNGVQASDRLTVLASATLTPQLNVPTDDVMKADGVPGLVVMGDDRTVAVYHASKLNEFWLTYFDRQTGTFATDRTLLPGCGVAHLLPLEPRQLAVLCEDTNDVRLVDLKVHQVVGTTALGQPQARNLPGWAISIGAVPGTSTIAVLMDDGRLLRIDPARQAVSSVAELALGSGQVVPNLGVAWSLSGQVVVALSTDASERASGKASKLLVLDLASGRILDTLPVPSYFGAGYFGVGITPDGARAFVRGPNRDDRLYVVDLTTRQVKDFGDLPPQLHFR
jgi:DNA-binding beta-propeller fold protein YncE